MKNKKMILLLILSMAVGISTAFGQERGEKIKPASERGRDAQAQFYRHSLQVDSAKASAVSKIQSDYKSGMALLVRDTSVTEEGRRAKFRELIEVKNAKLRRILTPSEQDKIIPTTERSVRPEPQREKRLQTP